MIRLVFFILFLCILMPLSAQEPTCPDSTFQRLLRQGAAFERTDFQKALRCYYAARNCRPEKTAEVDALIFQMFQTIESQRDEAKRQAKKARISQQKAEEALEQLEIASRTIFDMVVQEIEHHLLYVQFDLALTKAKAALPLVSNPGVLEPHLLEIAYVFNTAGNTSRAIEALDLVYTGIRKTAPPKTRSRGSDALQSEIQALSPAWFDTLHTVRYALSEMVFIEGGAFMMGCDSVIAGDTSCQKNEFPPHQVTLSSFYMSSMETTVWQFSLFCLSMGKELELYTGLSQAGNNAVVNVNWFQIAQYANWASQKMGWPPSYVFDSLGNFTHIDFSATPSFRMPTEAQWEYAARGGQKDIPTLYAGSNDIEEIAWYWENSAIKGKSQIHPVGLKKPNELGLYDMSGNAFEWVQDFSGNYSEEPAIDPTGPENGKNRVNRGGSRSTAFHACRVSLRNSRPPDAPHESFGFRLARIH
jgi:sulfatase modifying factor 1